VFLFVVALLIVLLREDGIYEEVSAAAIKRVLARQAARLASAGNRCRLLEFRRRTPNGRPST